jgi:hypothetical protein
VRGPFDQFRGAGFRHDHAALGGRNIRCRTVDIDDPPSPTGGIIRTLGQVRSVLKPGGLLLVDFPCTDTLDYRLLRERVAAGQIAEIEPNTFVDQRPDLDELDDDFLPHHYCDEDDLRDLLRPFEIIRLWAALRQSQDGAGTRGKWVASVHRPLSG